MPKELVAEPVKQPATTSRPNLRPFAYQGDYARYVIDDHGGVSIGTPPDPTHEILTADQLRSFAAELCEMAKMLEEAHNG